MLKLLKGLVFTLLAVLLLVAFVYPFKAVPKRYEQRAREITLARIEEGGAEVDARYVEQSVREAVESNLGVIFKTAFICALAGAAAVFLITVHPPHDHGGINLFNPIYLVFTAVISLLSGLVIALALNEKGGEAAIEFRRFIAELPGVFHEEAWRLLPLMLLWAAASELLFRGVVFSFIEKLHFSAALILAPVIYALALRFAAESFIRVSGAYPMSILNVLTLTALAVGFINCVITWRLRSVIPAVISHMLLAWAAVRIETYAQYTTVSLTAACAALGLVLAAFIVLPLFGRRFPVLAFDFPFTRHHMRMNNWLYGRRRLKQPVPAELNKTQEAGEKKAEESAEKAEEKAEQAVEKAEEKAEEAIEKAEEKAEQAVEKAEEKAEEAIEKAEEKAEDAIEKAEEKAEEAAEKAEEAAEKAEEKTEEKAANEPSNNGGNKGGKNKKAGRKGKK